MRSKCLITAFLFFWCVYSCFVLFVLHSTMKFILFPKEKVQMLCFVELLKLSAECVNVNGLEK